MALLLGIEAWCIPILADAHHKGFRQLFCIDF